MIAIEHNVFEDWAFPEKIVTPPSAVVVGIRNI